MFIDDPIFTKESTLEDYQKFLGMEDECLHEQISADYIYSPTGKPTFSMYCLACKKTRNSQEWIRLHS